MKIYLASDHAGYELKETLVLYLREMGYDIEDLGPVAFDPNDDYPDTILPLALKLVEEKSNRGIVIGASGQGEAMVCNRLKGVRAQVYYGKVGVQQTDASGHKLDVLASPRAHEDANVLALGARFLTKTQAQEAVVEWLQTPFSGEERHARRIAKLDA